MGLLLEGWAIIRGKEGYYFSNPPRGLPLNGILLKREEGTILEKIR